VRAGEDVSERPAAGASSLPVMERSIFRRFCQLAYQEAGIHLKEGKEALVSARVSKRLRALGLPDLRSYLDYLENDESGQELVHFLDVISTNFTRFFREPAHFELLRRTVQHWNRQGQHLFRVWSAAASSGEEPYSLAMVLLGLAETMPIDCRVLATDISSRMLSFARAGVYPDKAVAELPGVDRHKYFIRRGARGAADTTWEVRREVRARVAFHRLNLAAPPFPMRGPFDVVFCRNVMIYFDNPVRARLVAEIERLLRPGGLLVIGHAETLTAIKTNLRSRGPSVYVKDDHG
jgi:chemotaxis protein methyltransferase CheR